MGVATDPEPEEFYTENPEIQAVRALRLHQPMIHTIHDRLLPWKRFPRFAKHDQKQPLQHVSVARHTTDVPKCLTGNFGSSQTNIGSVEVI